MKKIIYIVVVFIAGCTVYNYDKVRKIPKQRYTPPGTIWLKGNLFIDKTEITNTNYREFLFWLSYHKLPLYKTMLPDTNIWGDATVYFFSSNGHGSKLSNTYFRHPAYNDSPVVGVSYNQAIEFCKWRTDRVNEFIYITKNKPKWNLDTIYPNVPKVVEYRLPSKQEWEYAASGGLDFNRYPWGYEKITNKKGIEVSNTAEYYNLSLIPEIIGAATDAKEGKKNTNHFDFAYTQSTNFGKPNSFGIFNMLGNVSEIIADTLYKGLNYTTPLSARTSEERDSIYNYKQTWKYKQPEVWLGFRCACEVINP